jgi:hypothetical protein
MKQLCLLLSERRVLRLWSAIVLDESPIQLRWRPPTLHWQMPNALQQGTETAEAGLAFLPVPV